MIFTKFKSLELSLTNNVTPGVETAIAHGIDSIPEFYIIIPTMDASIYQSKAADATNLYFKSDTANATARIIVIASNCDVWE